MLEEQDAQGALNTRYVYGHALLSQTRGTAINYYHYDGLGSTRALSDSTGMMTDNTYHYDAYGLLLDSTGSTSNPYRYRGEQYDPELSAYYLRARYYQPCLIDSLTEHENVHIRVAKLVCSDDICADKKDEGKVVMQRILLDTLEKLGDVEECVAYLVQLNYVLETCPPSIARKKVTEHFIPHAIGSKKIAQCRENYGTSVINMLNLVHVKEFRDKRIREGVSNPLGFYKE